MMGYVYMRRSDCSQNCAAPKCSTTLLGGEGVSDWTYVYNHHIFKARNLRVSVPLGPPPGLCSAASMCCAIKVHGTLLEILLHTFIQQCRRGFN